MLYSPLVGLASLNLTAAESESTALSEKAREVVILSVGAVWKAPYELYAHIAVARTVGLDQPTIDALVAEETPENLSSDERVAHEFTHRLVTEYQIDQALYQRALDAFGAKGLVDMIFLIGGYLTVCALLTTFSVPAPAGNQN